MSRSSRKNFRVRTSQSCESCDYAEHPEILTLHHLYARRNGKQPPLPRRLRYLIVCPNCHSLIEKRIISDKEIHAKVMKNWEVHNAKS